MTNMAMNAAGYAAQMPSVPMWRLNAQATGTSTATMARIEMAVGAITVPLARITPEKTLAMPKMTELHSEICSRLCARSITSVFVVNHPMTARENSSAITTISPVTATFSHSPVRVMASSRSVLPEPMACAPRIDAVIAIDMAGNCT